jgi:beta-phosphoglucomutase
LTQKKRIQTQVFEAVLFDMDGVLVDSMPNHVRAWVETFAEYGVELDPSLPCAREGEKALSTCLWLCEKYQLPWSKERCVRFVEEKRQRFRSYSGGGFFPEVEFVLQQLEAKNIPLALVTGSTIVNAKKVVPEVVWKRFKCHVTAEDVECGKPNPEPYLRATAALGLDSGKCLVVENAPFGIESARAAGCIVLALTTTLREDHLCEAHEVAASHTRILELIKEN